MVSKMIYKRKNKNSEFYVTRAYLSLFQVLKLTSLEPVNQIL